MWCVVAYNAIMLARQLGFNCTQHPARSGNVSTGLNIIVKSDVDAELLKKRQEH